MGVQLTIDKDVFPPDWDFALRTWRGCLSCIPSDGARHGLWLWLFGSDAQVCGLLISSPPAIACASHNIEQNAQVGPVVKGWLKTII